ncbi:MAG: hypothetical protein H7067_18910 [Burkholderiales bacterium]|nr:hypothetical protein [Opitutaceae bacterium]
MNHRFLSALSVAAFAASAYLPSLARAQSVSPGHPNYYPGVPANLINTQPRPGTFYYNDFNRYGYFHYPEGSYVYVPLAGFNSGANDSRDFSGQALIGAARGAISLAGDPLEPGTEPLRRVTSNFFKVNPGNLADPARQFTAPGGPTGEVNFQVTNNALAANLYGDGQGFRFAISTAGHENVRLSFDFGVELIDTSANYRFRASPDGGLTWTFLDESTLTNLGPRQWFNGIPAETNPQVFFDFSDHPEFDNNPNFVFQILNMPNPETGLWTSTEGQTAGHPFNMSIAFDRINLAGDALPVSTTPLQQWRQTHFGGPDAIGNAVNDADADGDGLVNLLEYALGGLPRDAASAPHPTTAVSEDKLQLVFARVADPALRYEVEAVADLTTASPWPVIWTSAGAQNVAGTVTVDDVEPLSEHPRRFLRLRITPLP